VTLDPTRKAYVHVVRGKVSVNGHALSAGDAAQLSKEAAAIIDKGDNAEVIVFDLAA